MILVRTPATRLHDPCWQAWANSLAPDGGQCREFIASDRDLTALLATLVQKGRLPRQQAQREA